MKCTVRARCALQDAPLRNKDSIYFSPSHTHSLSHTHTTTHAACFDRNVTYGLAVTGLDVKGVTFPVSLSTDGSVQEPDVRVGQPPITLKGVVTVTGLTAGGKYTLYRYLGTETLPTGPSNWDVGYEAKTPFTAQGSSWVFADPLGFESNSAVYYVAVAAA